MADASDNFGFPVVELPSAAARSATATIKFLVGHLVDSGRLRPEDADRVTRQVLHRESLGSTGIGRGFALPHSKSDAVGEVIGIVGRSADGVNWNGAMDGKPVHVVCLLVTPTSEPGASLRALETVTRKMRGE